MGLVWFFSIILLIIITVFIIDIINHRHPLIEQEIVKLSKKRQRNNELKEYAYSKNALKANPAVKKSMKVNGQLLESDINYYISPSYIAGLLKSKKHEWIVLAFIKSKKVKYIWWNKGPNGNTVWSKLDKNTLKSAISISQPDTIAILHNHPNPNPSRYRVNEPSHQDLISAEYYDTEFAKHHINLLEFVCERGIPFLFYASFYHYIIPLQPIISEITKINGKNIFKNYSLRKELKKRTLADQIHGGQRNVS